MHSAIASNARPLQRHGHQPCPLWPAQAQKLKSKPEAASDDRPKSLWAAKMDDGPAKVAPGPATHRCPRDALYSRHHPISIPPAPAISLR
ncbi:hypothetical protein EVG20_g10350 [Dentipellis fragilis]|uniref:Uncharacterized protein n=1 Tax=Dentipellis fragilis TaxID=205917 RepID=A0A4Y9XT14_9AGAM|nr:hypothetical protein EVG20_g10350 [Dentipellis fragilis]